MIFAKAQARPAEVDSTGAAAEARLYGAAAAGLALRAGAHLAHALPACPLHQRVSGDHRDDSCDSQLVSGRRRAVTAEDVAVAQIVHDLHLEGGQAEEASVGRQRPVRCDPQGVGVDEADVEEPPEEVLPPTPARTPHPVVGSQLVQLVDLAHVLVVASNADRHRDGGWLAVAAGAPR